MDPTLGSDPESLKYKLKADIACSSMLLVNIWYGGSKNPGLKSTPQIVGLCLSKLTGPPIYRNSHMEYLPGSQNSQSLPPWRPPLRPLPKRAAYFNLRFSTWRRQCSSFLGGILELLGACQRGPLKGIEGHIRAVLLSYFGSTWRLMGLSSYL